MKFVFTDGQHPGFIELCGMLDAHLNVIAGGEENRAQFIPFNTLDDIRDVVLATEKEMPAGCASFKRYDNETAEVKRVFVKTEFRRRGIAKQLLELLEDRARMQGFRRMVLETGEPLSDSIALYQKAGFRVIMNYGQYRDMPASICMEKWL